MKIRYFSRRRMATPISAKVFLGRGGGLAVCPQTHSYPQKRPTHSLWNTGAFEITSLDHSTSTALENFPHLIFPHIICSCDNLKWAFLTTKIRHFGSVESRSWRYSPTLHLELFYSYLGVLTYIMSSVLLHDSWSIWLWLLEVDIVKYQELTSIMGCTYHQ